MVHDDAYYVERVTLTKMPERLQLPYHPGITFVASKGLATSLGYDGVPDPCSLYPAGAGRRCFFYHIDFPVILPQPA